MHPTIWDPFRELEQLMERYNRSTDKHLAKKQDNSLFRADWAPSVDVKETPNGFDLRGLFQTLLNNGASCRDAEITSTSIDDGNGAFRTSQNIFNPRTQK